VEQVSVRALRAHLPVGTEDLSGVVDPERDQEREARRRDQRVEVLPSVPRSRAEPFS